MKEALASRADSRGAILVDLVAARTARAAHLRYVSDSEAGLRRVGRAGAFSYVTCSGKRVDTASTLARIQSLVIPPAWTDVWICSSPDGHIQATGRDTRGRKQYRYHPAWSRARDASKYDRTLALCEALPVVRRRVSRDLSLPGLPRKKVQALVVRLLYTTFLRIGNDEYARTNHSFGLTTLRDSHVLRRGTKLQLRFRGKTGKEQTVVIADPRVVRAVRECRDLPGKRLFQYVDPDHRAHPVTSADVNAYLREISGQDLTAKDFRTWAGTRLALRRLQGLPAAGSIREAKSNLKQAILAVAKRLGNTPAVCRKSYIHPHLVEIYLAGNLSLMLKRKAAPRNSVSSRGLDREDLLLRALLRSYRRSEPRRQAQPIASKIQ